jgi:mRNA-degrading endonuclease RelE of RelBE toxin-antitoxin system
MRDDMSAPNRHIEISTRAERDLRQLDRRDRDRVVDGLRRLAAEPPPANLDVKAIAGALGWSRLRIGDFRVLYRQLTQRELVALERVGAGILVARIVNRRELERAVRSLETIELD